MASASATSSLLQRVRERRAEAELLQQTSAATPSVAVAAAGTNGAQKQTLGEDASKSVVASTSVATNKSAGETKTSQVKSEPSKSLQPPPKPKDDVLEGRVTWRDPFDRDLKELPSQSS
jgi:hypothetical protein